MVQSDFNVSFNFPPVTPAAPGQIAYLYPPSLPSGTGDVTLEFLNLGGPGAAPGNCSLPALNGGGTQNVFTLSWTTTGSQTPLTVANIAIPGQYAYATSDQDRDAVAAAFSTFRMQVDLLEYNAIGTASPCLLPGQGRILVDRVARALSMRVSEAASYYFNLAAANRSVDLTPGMRLKILGAGYQYGGNAQFQEPASPINAFSGNWALPSK